MEDSWNVNLPTVLKAHKLIPVLISTKGNEQAFSSYKTELANIFVRSATVWKKKESSAGGKSHFRLYFPLKFTPFDERLCWEDGQDGNFTSTAFLHIFFISVASVEEYRTSVRHNASEWFAKVSTKPNVEWLIVIDSTKAKEKKNRTALLDKLRSDFSKFQNKLIEVSESVEHGSFAGLLTAVQNSILNHLTLSMPVWENVIAFMRESHLTDDSWRLVPFAKAVIEYVRFFWSMGAMDHALSALDALDNFISQCVIEASQSDDTPSWLAVLKKARCSKCPTLRQLLLHGFNNTSDSFLELKNLILTYKVLLCLHMYNAKSKIQGAPPSIRVDFSGMILDYAHAAVRQVLEQTEIAQLAITSTQLAIWKMFIFYDICNIINVIGIADVATVDTATDSFCYLHLERVRSMFLIWRSDKSNLIDWLPPPTHDSTFRMALESNDVFSTQLQKIHDTASAALTQCGRHRISSHIGNDFAEFLRSIGKIDLALPYELRFLSQLLDDFPKAASSLQMIESVLPNLHEVEDQHRILSYLLLQSIYHNDYEKKLKAANNWLEKIKEVEGRKIKLSSLPHVPSNLISIKVTHFSEVVQHPCDNIEIEIEVSSLFPVAIPYSMITAFFRSIEDSNIFKYRTSPIFELVYNERDEAIRLLAPYSNLSSHSEKQEKSPGVAFTLKSGVTILQSGQSSVTLTCPASSRGVYILDRIELSLSNQSIVTSFTDVPVPRPLVIFVCSVPNKLSATESTDYFAGVAQVMEVNLEPGSYIETSLLEISCADEHAVEFLTESGEWKPSLKRQLTALDANIQHNVKFGIFVRLDQSMTDSPAVHKVKLAFTWLEKTWTLDLPFVPLLIMSPKLTQMESRNLYELEMCRTLADEWTIILEEVDLVALTEPETPATLMNPSFEDLVPNIVTNLVWILPQSICDNSMSQFKLSIKYRVVSCNSADIKRSDLCDVTSRNYLFSSIFELKPSFVAYELCSQMLSQQPGAQLCRAGSPCDMVVSLRSFHHMAEMLYIVLDADARFWSLNERAKVLHVKESGLGQIAFSIVPCEAGFLPYPTVSVYSCITLGRGGGETIDEMDVLPGSSLVSFHRTAGKQIRVLSASLRDHKAEDRKEGLKQKIVKLFD